MKMILAALAATMLVGCATVKSSPLVVVGQDKCYPIKEVPGDLLCVQVMYYNPNCKFLGAKEAKDEDGLDVFGVGFVCQK